MLENILSISCTPKITTISTSTSAKSYHSQSEHGRASSIIIGRCKELLDTAQLKISDLQAIVVDVGPGSFTSIRIAYCVAMGLSIIHSIPILPISHLELLAAEQPETKTGEFMIATNAYMQEFYWAKFIYKDNKLVRLSPDTLSPISILIEQSKEVQIIGWTENTFFTDILFSPETLLKLTKQCLDNAQSHFPKVNLKYLRGEEYWKTWQQN